MTNQRFNIRVYGLLVRDGHVLVSHELIAGKSYAKFPGGGLEFGEGTKDAVIREFGEELGVEVCVKSHFYTTDFYLPSAFDSKDQIISIYYKVESARDEPLPFHLPPPSEEELMTQPQLFRWYPIDRLNDDLIRLPADRVVVRMLQGAGPLET